MLKYHSLTNTYRLTGQEKYEGTFSVQEKIHGANFQVWFDEEGKPHYASRKYELNSPADIFEAGEIEERVVPLLPRNPDFIYFGELFGQGIMGGVFYSDRKEFLVFDIYDKKEGRYLTVAEMEKVLPGNLRVDTLFVGTFQECLDFNTEFNSLVPARFNLNSPEDNICEGIVIKAYDKEVFDRHGHRVVLKKKNEKFSEVTAIKQPTPHSHLLVYLNENRIQSYLSKEGGVIKDMGKAIREIAEDIQADFGGEISKKEMKTLKNKIAAALVPYKGITPRVSP